MLLGRGRAECLASAVRAILARLTPFVSTGPSTVPRGRAPRLGDPARGALSNSRVLPGDNVVKADLDAPVGLEGS